MTVVELSKSHDVEYSKPARISACRPDWRRTERLLCDGLALCAAFAAATVFHFDDADLASLLPRALALHWLCLFVAEAYGERDFLFGERRREISAAAKGALAGALLLVASAPPRLEASWLLVHAAAYPLAVTLLTAAGRALVGGRWRDRRAPRKVLIAGDALLAEELRAELARRRGRIDAVAFRGTCEAGDDSRKLERAASRIICSAAASGAEEVVYCDRDLAVSDAAFLAERLSAAGLTVRIVSERIGRLAGSLPLDVERWRGMPVVEFRAPRQSAWVARAKRMLDQMLAVVALAACLPLWALLAPVARVLQGRGLFHRQLRVNRGGRLFAFYKIRTMSDPAPETFNAPAAAPGPLPKVIDDPRVTPLGRRLRRFSIDETPQFVNVLRGDISIIGARPPLPSEVEQYEPWQRCRLSGWMGITGLWQTCGRSDLGFGEMVFLDLFYNCNWSLLLDLRILWRTVVAVVGARGAY